MPVFEVDESGDPVPTVCFSNGTLNREGVKLTSFTSDDDRPASKKLQIVSAEIDGIHYSGQNFGARNRFPQDDFNYYMCVHDRRTGKIRVLPANPIQMDPVFEKKDKQDEFSGMTEKEKNMALATTFGSGKSRTAVNRRLREKMEEGMVKSTADTVVNDSEKTAAANPAATLTPDNSRSDAIPPYNADAEKPDDVYKLKDLVNMESLQSLKEEAIALLKSSQEQRAAWRKEKKYSSFVLNRVDNLPLAEEARLIPCQCLVYLQCLMNLYAMKSIMLRNKFPLPKEWPQALKDYLLNKFTLEVKEPGKKFKRCIPDRLRNLLLSHILIICLKMKDFCIDLDLLVTDLSMSASKLATHARFLGCLVRTSKPRAPGQQAMTTVILKVPLTFPTLSKRKK